MRQSLIVIALLVAGPAFAQPVGQKPASQRPGAAPAAPEKPLGEKSGANPALGVAPKTPEFIKDAAIGDMFEILSGKMAEAKLSGGAGQSFADQMVTDHTKTSNELDALAKGARQTLPPDMDAAHKRMINQLNSLDGDAFQKQYFADQVSAHKDAVSLFQRYAKGGDNAKLKEWAATTLPTLQKHLETAQQLDK